MLDKGFYNMDCMEGMKQFPDKFFELAIVDPPYGIGAGNKNFTREGKQTGKSLCVSGIGYKKGKWDNSRPTMDYFNEVQRVSANQIIWGGNYFNLRPSRCMICWDKQQDMPTLSAWELGWTSFDKPSKIFKKSSTDVNRFHPTQKPVALYTWLLRNYAKQGDKILDTHVGSASSLIACHRMGFEYWGYELDQDYFKAATERLEREKSMQPLFAPQEIYKQEGLTFDT